MDNNTDNSKNSIEFRRGLRTFFSFLSYKAANNFHGDPNINKVCDSENDVVLKWAIEALEELSPEDHKEWKNILELQTKLNDTSLMLNVACDRLQKLDPMFDKANFMHSLKEINYVEKS